MNNTSGSYKYKYVLLIDDVELDNFINEKLISSNNFSEHTYISTSAQAALEFLTNLDIAAAQFPDIYPKVIFIDINMPVMDGFQFITFFREAIRKQNQQPKLVILTSSVAERDRQVSSEIDENIIFLNKPLSKEMLEKL
jgi:CheY-like chemotaxis protein